MRASVHFTGHSQAADSTPVDTARPIRVRSCRGTWAAENSVVQDVTFIVCRRDGTLERSSTDRRLSIEEQRRVAVACAVDAASVPLDSGLARMVLLHPDHVLVIATSCAKRLTPRQREIAELASVGATVDEIARSLQVSPYTVRQHLKAVYRQLDVGNRVELAQAIGVCVS